MLGLASNEGLGRTGVTVDMSNFISRAASQETMQAWTLRACFAVCFLNCLILVVSFLALAGNRVLRLELNSMATRLAALEAKPLQPPQGQ